MAKKKISQLTGATSLDGSELVPVVKNGQTLKTTTQDIATLVAGNGSDKEWSEMVFITEENLNAEGNYVITTNDFGKLLLVIIDKNIVPDISVVLPTSLGADQDVNGKKINLCFFDAGKFQNSSNNNDSNYFVHPLNAADAIALSEPNGDSWFPEIIECVVYNTAINSYPRLLTEKAVIFDTKDEAYKTEAKYFYDNISPNYVDVLTTVTYAEINAAPATQKIQISLNRLENSLYYPSEIFWRIRNYGSDTFLTSETNNPAVIFSNGYQKAIPKDANVWR